ncbi:MAG TPA: FGGY-family carbohydrate kinase [Acidimicrobiales bacterium]
MKRRSGGITVGVDIGTTAVKAIAVDEQGNEIGRSRVPHKVLAPEPHVLRHDARRAWRIGPKKAYDDVVAQLGGESVDAVAVAAMVPSLTAVNQAGVPTLPGLLYGDTEGRRPEGAPNDLSLGAMPDAEGFLRWAVRSEPQARGYWPAQAVATHALTGTPAVDTGVTASLGMLHSMGKWNTPLLEEFGACEAQMPMVTHMGAAGGTIPGTDTVFTGGSIDAFCDQIVSGAFEPGDVLVIFGATLITWAITTEWLMVPGLISYPHTTPDRFMIGGPSNAGALFVDWARQLLRGTPKPGPGREELPHRIGRPDRVPVWLPYIRGERTPFEDHSLLSNIYGLDIGTDGAQLERAAFEASGFVVRRLVEMSGVRPRRIVASGGGSRVTAWMAAVADATNLPVEAVAGADGGARGAAYLARLAAGLETSLEGSARWASIGRCIEPDSDWVGPTDERYRRFCDFGTGK